MDRGRGKNTKFFLGLEKSRQMKKSITALRSRDGKILEDPSQILDIEKEYYEGLYKSTNPNLSEIKNYINETCIDHKLNNQDCITLSGELTIEECTKAIFSMKKNKSPGIDGLSVEFYQTFWNNLDDLEIPVFNINVIEKGS